ncbi:MAG: MBL fold metallo-hydrolase [Enterococcaceae bacterium]|jgi:beta-lactamase superfamily II metal-dependent hydrolase|nr:MBL fold metallo-hydrolase [Enterococcaceae bacterium]MCI1918658.1 MBL fold metallo-hydrolase [Enterococcaceae bacterium]
MIKKGIRFCLAAASFIGMAMVGAKEADAAEKIHFINVNGDATLIESDGHYALIDGGEDSDNPTNKGNLNLIGTEQHVLDYLHRNIPKQNGKIKLDFIVGTHAHSDHIGGLRYVVNDSQIEVGKVYFKRYNANYMNQGNLAWDNQEEYDLFVNAVNKKGIPIISDFREYGSADFTFGNYRIQFYNTGYLNYQIQSEADRVDENVNSISTVVTSKDGKRVYLGGDSNKTPNPQFSYGLEHELAKEIEQVDLMKLNHHGASDANSQELLDKLRPSYAVLIGNNPSFSFDKGTEKYLAAVGTNVFLCHTAGDIVADLESQTLGLEKYQGSLPIRPIERKPSTPAMDENFSGWKQHEKNWYFKENGTLKKGQWHAIGSTWYNFQNSGVMRTGWFDQAGAWYLLDPLNGDMKKGWYQDGVGKWFYFAPQGQQDGIMQTGWQYLNGIWYYLDSSGAMVTGWKLLGNTWYYLDGSGAMATGWRYVGGHWYYFETSGAMATGWKLLGSTWYYLDSGGAMTTGWKMIGGHWYFFYANGAMR